MRINMMARFVAALVLGSILFWSGPTSAAASNETRVFHFTLTNEPFYFHYFCANGEDVLMNGDITLVISTTIDGQGGAEMLARQSGHFRLTGLTTGSEYIYQQMSGYTAKNSYYVWPWVFTQTVNSRIIGQGPDAGFVMRDIAHFTMNANGEISVTFERTVGECGN